MSKQMTNPESQTQVEVEVTAVTGRWGQSSADTLSTSNSKTRNQECDRDTDGVCGEGE